MYAIWDFLGTVQHCCGFPPVSKAILGGSSGPRGGERIYVYIHIHIYASILLYTYADVFVYVDVGVAVTVYVHVYVYVFVVVYVYAYCLCESLCIRIWKRRCR